jgi:DNA-binding LacI/PurR family transcriptional regulator
MTQRARRAKKVTVTEVARLAGVAPATVSRVTTGASYVTPETRERVMRSIRQTGYRPSSAAVSLKRQAHDCFGLVLEEGAADSYYGSALVRGVAAAAGDRGFRVAVATLPSNSEASDLHRLPMLSNVSTDGLVVDLPHPKFSIRDELERLQMPWVVVNPTEELAHNAVCLDDMQIAGALVQYLSQRGHRQIVYVENQSSFHSPLRSERETRPHISQERRRDGYLRAMTDLKLQPVMFWEREDTEIEFVSRLQYWIDQGITAVLCYSTGQAAKICQAAAVLRLNVPDDLVVVGCDYDPIIKHLLVKPAYALIDRVAIGRMAAEMLMQRLESDENRPVARYWPDLVTPHRYLEAASQVESLSPPA